MPEKSQNYTATDKVTSPTPVRQFQLALVSVLGKLKCMTEVSQKLKAYKANRKEMNCILSTLEDYS